MRWPWRRRHTSGEAAQANRAADRQWQEAQDRARDADRAARTAEALTRRTDRFTREVERSWHLRGSA